MFRDVPGGFGRGGEQFGDLRGIGRRFQLLQAFVAHRRQRERAHSVDDPIEFERPKGGSVHTRET